MVLKAMPKGLSAPLPPYKNVCLPLPLTHTPLTLGRFDAFKTMVVNEMN
jgi:hypothetical protein